MHVTVRSAALALCVAGAFLTTAAAAQDTVSTPPAKAGKAAAKAKTAAAGAAKERRPGELEGWDSGVTAPLAGKKKRPADAIGEKELPDGGLPLPTQTGKREPGPGEAPVGFDKGGNMGAAFKF